MNIVSLYVRWLAATIHSDFSSVPIKSLQWMKLMLAAGVGVVATSPGSGLDGGIPVFLQAMN